MNYRETKKNADLLFNKEKVNIQIFLDKYCEKYAKKNLKLDYHLNSKKTQKSKEKIDLELIYEMYPLNENRNKSIKSYEYRSYKFTLFSCDSLKQNKICISKWSNQLAKIVLNCQLYLLGSCKMTKENIFDLIFKLFFKNNVHRFANEFRGKSIEIIRFVMVDVLPILFVSGLIIDFIIDNPDASYLGLLF